MRILFLAHSSQFQGSGKALINIIDGLIENYDVEIEVALPGNGEIFDELNKRKITYYSMPFSNRVYPNLKSLRDFILYIPRLFRLLIKEIISAILLFRLIKKLKPDVIHTNVGTIHLGSFIAKRFSIPHVWHIREFQLEYFGWIPFPSMKSFFRKIKHRNNHLIAITNDIFSHYTMDIKKDKVIYDGVFSNAQIPTINPKNNYFLFVGNLSQGKGIDEVVNAFIEFSKSKNEYKLLIAGQGDFNYIQKLKNIIFESGIVNKVEFLGYRNDVYSLMSKAKALIVASKSEGFGFITAEAMYNGCLVIGKDLAGTKEQFDNGLKAKGAEIGIRYKAIDDLVKAMILVSNNEIDSSIIKNAQETVLNLYSIENNTKEIYNLYLNLINNRK